MEGGPITFIIIAAAVFFLSNQILRQAYFVKIDPLIIIAVHVSLTIAAVLYEARDIRPAFVFSLIVMHFAFLAGVAITHKMLPYRKLHSAVSVKRSSDVDVGKGMLVFCVLYIVYAVAVWSVFGLLILSEDPEYYKLQFSTGGFGFVSRIAVGLVLPLFFFIALAWKNCSWFVRTIPILALLLALGSIGKSVIIQFITAWLIASAYKSKIQGIKVNQSFSKLFFYVFLALAFALLVLELAYGTSDDSSGEWLAFSLLLERITTAPGLGLVTYLQNDLYFDSVLSGDVLKYLWGYFIVPIAAPLRLADYVPAAGRELGIFLTGSEDYGPNPTVYGEAFIYFGAIFGCIYSFLIGSLISIMRYMAVFFASKSTSILGALAFAYLYSALLTLSTDFLVFMAMLSSYMIYIAIALICVFALKVVQLSISRQ